MKTYFLQLLALLYTLSLPAQDHPEPVTLSIGAAAPAFLLKGTDGKTYTLNSFADAKVLAVIFSCNHCPTAQAYEERIKQLAKDYAAKQVAVVVISPNSPAAVNLGELGYTEMGDTYEEMQLRAKQHDFNFPYLYDGDDQQVSIAYGPVATPHAFVFDEARKLRYTGRLDSKEKPGTGQAEDIRSAIDALLQQKEVAHPVQKTFGCSIKWAWKDEWSKKINAEWARRPVTLDMLDAAGVKELVGNSGDKLRLINIWATWCGPCIQELPEFVNTDRMYRERDFEFITITTDNPDKKDKALAMLKKLEASNKNYLYSGADKYQLIEAVDPDWQGALPYTLLVEPGGRVVFRKQGAVNMLELRRAIVEHKLMGRYY
ncbi:redoxin family protein [Chitinophaga japonensis]|uniref:Peroxiredoxin n=1 Tax=Chitinophaga japonensis TaxID=104662 RepID=A0A562TC18_CHIJA|nr:redoxin family protein [Chitinophaga japonensis]TWI91097.1 peroxiredoxin [Chitinophaga japonensis]